MRLAQLAASSARLRHKAWLNGSVIRIMGFLVTEAQRTALEAGGTAALPTTIMAVLRENHAR